MLSGSMSLAVVIHGPKGAHEAREYLSPVDHDTYVEGREGSSFTLRIRNGSHRRVLAVPSVDGLSVLDGKPAGSSSPGYVLDPWQTLEVVGWKVDGDTAARFFFAGSSPESDGSYVAAIGGDIANKGVIGAIFFAEERSERPMPVFRGRQRGSMLMASSASVSKGVMRSMPLSAEAQSQTLGAGFGEATGFRTRTVSFRRGSRIAGVSLRYDDARGLKRRGIDVSRPSSGRPSAFPADDRGCAPPPGWQR
jgi:hypothetical protein